MNLQSQYAITIENLSKSYEGTTILDKINLNVPSGCIFGLLGPNGAGKTTLIEIIEGIRHPDSGRVAVCGLNPFSSSRELKQLIGVQLQETKLNDINTVHEIFKLFSSFYKNKLGVDQVLEAVKLGDQKNQQFKNLSGGQKQLVAIGLALLGKPQLIFLDEPTVGLDVHARIEIYEVIKKIKSTGKTIFLTTHYLEEAEALCDLVAILDRGNLVANGRPKDLIQTNLGHEKIITFEFKNKVSEKDIILALNILDVEYIEGRFSVRTTNIEDFSHTLMRYSAETNNPLVLVRTNQVKLQDLFIKLTRSQNNA